MCARGFRDVETERRGEKGNVQPSRDGCTIEPRDNPEQKMLPSSKEIDADGSKIHGRNTRYTRWRKGPRKAGVPITPEELRFTIARTDFFERPRAFPLSRLFLDFFVGYSENSR